MAVVDRPAPPYKAVGAIALVLLVIGAVLLWGQFRGAFAARVGLTLVSPRAGLVVDPGSKVTLNGVEIGRVMSSPPIVISPEASVAQATRVMAENKIGCLPVVSGDELLGLITETDVLRYFAGYSGQARRQ